MALYSIEPGQRLQMKSGDASAVVEVIAEAVVPFGYWLCRNEASGHRTVIANTALFPIVAEVAGGVSEAPMTTVPAAA